MKKNLEERLRAHPGLYERINRLVEVVENAAGDVNKAAEAERRVIEELRQMGQEALQGWAERRQEVVEQAAEADSALSRKEKKTLLAQLLRGNLGNRADLSSRSWWEATPSVCRRSGDWLSRVFATSAASVDRLRCRIVLWQSGRTSEGTLRDRGAKRSRATDHRTSRRSDAQATTGVQRVEWARRPIPTDRRDGWKYGSAGRCQRECRRRSPQNAGCQLAGSAIGVGARARFIDRAFRRDDGVGGSSRRPLDGLCDSTGRRFKNEDSLRRRWSELDCGTSRTLLRHAREISNRFLSRQPISGCGG